jgi:fructose-bisphosphate aldolase class I
MMNATMAQQMAKKDGFIAALDQSGGSTPKALKLYGVAEDAYSNDDRDVRADPRHARPHHQVSGFHRRKGDRRDPVRTHHGWRDRRRSDRGLSVDKRGIVPFLKVDQGLMDEQTACS